MNKEQAIQQILKSIEERKIIENTLPNIDLCVVRLIGPKPKLGKNKTRAKIRESNKKYAQKVLEAKKKIKSLQFALTFVQPLMRKFDYQKISKEIIKIQPLEYSYRNIPRRNPGDPGGDYDHEIDISECLKC